MRVIQYRYRPARAAAGGLAAASVALYLFLQYFKVALAYLLPAVLLEYVNILVLAAGAIALISQIGLGAVRLYGLEICWGSLFVLMVSLSSIVAGATSVLASTAYDICSVCVIYILFAGTARTGNGLRVICITLAMCAAANSSVGLWGAVTHQTLFHAGREAVGVGAFGYDATTGRSGGIVGENYAGMYDLPAIIAGFALLYQQRWYLPAFGLVLLGVLGTVVSMSRTSSLSAIVALVVFVALSSMKSRTRRVIWIPTFTLITGAIGFFAYTYYFNSLDPKFQKSMAARWSEDGFAQDDRLDLWRKFSNDVVDSPILGKGAAYIQKPADITTQWKSGYLVPHNSLLEIAVEFGLPAVVVFAVALLRPLRAARSAIRDVRTRYLYASFIGMFVSLQFLSFPFNRVIWAVGGSLFGAWQTEAWARRYFSARLRSRRYYDLSDSEPVGRGDAACHAPDAQLQQ